MKPLPRLIATALIIATGVTASVAVLYGAHGAVQFLLGGEW